MATNTICLRLISLSPFLSEGRYIFFAGRGGGVLRLHVFVTILPPISDSLFLLLELTQVEQELPGLLH